MHPTTSANNNGLPKMSEYPKPYSHGGYSVTVAEDGAIAVQPGDMISKYCMAIHHDFELMQSRFGRENQDTGVVEPVEDVNRIEAGKTIYHIPTHEIWLKKRPPQDPKQDAIRRAFRLIDEFEKRAGHRQAFVNIQRQDVVDGLRARVSRPRKIDQKTAGVCPSASLIFIEAKQRPDDYVQFVIDLFENGVGYLRGWKVTPCRDLRYYVPPAGAIHVADWIPMSSIRDSENWWWEYQQVASWWNAFWGGGATAGEISNWLFNAGYRAVLNETTMLGNATRENLMEASFYHRNNWQVILRIDADIFSLEPEHWNNPNPPIFGRGNHVVVLTSDVKISNQGGVDYVDFTVYTWGKSRKKMVPDGAARVRLDVFLNYYYGFVAAKF